MGKEGGTTAVSVGRELDRRKGMNEGRKEQ